MSRPASRDGSPASSRPSSLYSVSGLDEGKPRNSTERPLQSEVCVLLKPPPSAHAFLNIQIQLVNRPEQQRKTSSATDSSPARTPSRPSSESSFAQVAHATTSILHRESILGSGSSSGQHHSVHSSPTSENGPEPAEALTGAALSRTSSGRSNRSSSGSSFFSATSSRRATTPLYNLEYHRVLPTVITDAGTEAKVARVLKRGIEVHELAQIEAVEMTADGQRPPKLAALARSHTAEGTQSPPKPLPPPPTATATATAESQAEAESVSDAASVDSNVTSASATAAKDNTFLGRFKRMSFKPKDMAFKPPANMLKAPSFAAAFKAPTFGKPSMAPAVDVASAPDAAAAAAAAGLAAQAPAQTLGMFKTEAPSGLDETPIGKHAAGYVWSVRKFLRPDLEGKEQLLDMSVEWKKRRLGKAGGRPGRASKSNVAPSSEAAVSAPSTPTLGRASMDAATPQAPGSPSASSSKTPEPSQLLQARQQTAHQSRRSSIISTRSGVGEGPAAAAAHTEEEDSGDESDPDDSESPWICELVLPPPTTMIDVPPHSTRRIRLGVFKPAPHHPRLVGQVSIPLSLRRVSLGLPRDPDDEKAGSETISAEEMKDLLCITLLWMTIRESLGGVARRKKNEGPFRNL